MAGLWFPVLGIAIGAIATVVAARINARAADKGTGVGERSVAVTEMQAALAEQRNMLDRAKVERAEDRTRIEALEADVAECEFGRDRDRKAFSAELAELRAELRSRP